MLTNAQSTPGRTIELQFGELPEAYSLTVVCDQTRGDWNWILYRLEKSGSCLEWNYTSNDPRWVHHMIAGQFPRWDLRAVGFTSQEIAKPDSQRRPLVQLELPKSKPTLEGDLRNLQMPGLLQSIAINKLSGRLDIEGVGENAIVWFFEGTPQHCRHRDRNDDGALIELIGWTDGNFRFYPEADVTTHYAKTIVKRLDRLLMEGAAFQDQSQFLESVGLKLESYVSRNHESMPELLFTEMVTNGTGTPVQPQKDFYLRIDGKSTLVDILRDVPMTKAEWVPVVFNLVTCGLISFRDEISPNSAPGAPSINLDWSLVHHFEKHLLSADYGIYNYPAFLFFLEREHLRFERFQRPFSLILIAAECPPDHLGLPQNVNQETIGDLCSRVIKLKRKTDVLGHFGEAHYGLILAETAKSSASEFAGRLSETMTNVPLAGTQERPAMIAFGVASVPEDCQSLPSLLSLARPAVRNKP